MSELSEIRERQGFNLREALRGVQHVAARILDADGNPLVSIEVVGAANRMTEEKYDGEVSDAVRATANGIELSVLHSE